jgi:DNA ligase-1
MVRNIPPDMLVPTFLINDLNDLRTQFQGCIQKGYEGLIIRSVKGRYRQNYRSPDLLKYKEFLEDEFIITDCKEGEGREKGSVIWVCETTAGHTFAVRPKGSLEHRRALYTNAKKHIGQYITVIYQELTEQGIPRFPVGKEIRDIY